MRNRSLSMVLLAVLLSWRAPVRSEVAVDLAPQITNTVVFGAIIGDDSDPIGVWLQYRSIPPNQVLNPAGHARGDGRPDIAFKIVTNPPDPTAFWPLAAWAYNAGTDRDIAIAEWNGTAWTSPEFLTSGSEDELDPRVFIELEGTAHVVWWVDSGVDRIVFSTRPTASTLWNPAADVAQSGRRPSIAVHQGTLRIAFERTSSIPGMAQDVVVLRQEPNGDFVEEWVISTPRTERLDAVLHARAGWLWIDWKHGGQTFGCAQFAAGIWGAIGEPAWTDPSWVGVEAVRKAIAVGMTAP